ncbi:MAG: HU family DNA-binding protein [Dysgonamonadaceae bacterium]|jgi:nucleoid DNA-binding protein|nr:HU family DNA-binding protein [Dysgonamonadaceae bacterium]
MNNSEVIHALSKRLNMRSADVSKYISATVSVISEQLAENREVAIPLIGTMEVKRRQERLSVNPVSGKRFMVPPKSVVTLKPFPSLKEKMQDNTHE